jgi:hypothetical protein
VSAKTTTSTKAPSVAYRYRMDGLAIMTAGVPANGQRMTCERLARGARILVNVLVSTPAAQSFRFLTSLRLSRKQAAHLAGRLWSVAMWVGGAHINASIQNGPCLSAPDAC